MFAFLPSLGWTEMLMLLVLGLLLYGRNLPDAGRSMGRFVAQLKRGFHDFKEQMDRDESLREVRKTFEDTTREVRNLTTLPRAIADPAGGLRTLARDALTAPPPPAADTNANAGAIVDPGDGEAAADVPDEPPPPSAEPSPEGEVPETPPPPSLLAALPQPRANAAGETH